MFGTVCLDGIMDPYHQFILQQHPQQLLQPSADDGYQSSGHHHQQQQPHQHFHQETSPSVAEEVDEDRESICSSTIRIRDGQHNYYDTINEDVDGDLDDSSLERGPAPPTPDIISTFANYTNDDPTDDLDLDDGQLLLNDLQQQQQETMVNNSSSRRGGATAAVARGSLRATLNCVFQEELTSSSSCGSDYAMVYTPSSPSGTFNAGYRHNNNYGLTATNALVRGGSATGGEGGAESPSSSTSGFGGQLSPENESGAQPPFISLNSFSRGAGHHPLAHSSQPQSQRGPVKSAVDSVKVTRTKLIKEGLKLTIQSKRRAKGLKDNNCSATSIMNSSSPGCYSGNGATSGRRGSGMSRGSDLNSSDWESGQADVKDELTEEDEERRRRRRERNKVAATKCRNKKKERTQKLHVESNCLESSIGDLTDEIGRLEREKQSLIDTLRQHWPSCSANQLQQSQQQQSQPQQQDGRRQNNAFGQHQLQTTSRSACAHAQGQRHAGIRPTNTTSTNN